MHVGYLAEGRSPGAMGIAILSIILTDLKKPNVFQSSPSDPGTSTPMERVPTLNQLPPCFIACIRLLGSEKMVRNTLKKISLYIFGK